MSFSRRLGLGLIAAAMLLAAANALSHAKTPDEKPVESEHRKGPNGWEGWTLLYSIPEDQSQKFAFTLVLARNGKVVRRIDGDPFVWNWMFWADGKQVAYESGPLHFGMSCILADIQTGRQLGIVDCYHELPDDAPDWAVKLETAR
jgi:hypothetical protein